MKLSVVILNYNVRYFLELCLKSVEAALVAIDSEIIVVDNHSADDSCAMVKQLFPKVKLLENKENLGFSKGNNQGVAIAKGEYLCILNPDTVVAEDTFTSLLHFAETQNKLGILGCKLIDGQGQFLSESKRHVPTPWVSVKKMLGFTAAYYVPELDADGVGEIEILVGAFMLLKRAVYNEVGGFDEAYFMYGDDIDLSYKTLKQGYQNSYFGKTTVIHYKGESTLKDKVYAKRFYGAMQIFYKKHFKANPIFNIMVWIGIRLASVMQKPEIVHKSVPKQRFFISEEKNEALQNRLGQALEVRKSLESYLDDSEFILNNNDLSFKRIIEIIDHKPKNCSARFKILPKNSNFILGSDSSKYQGEVITFH
ncbi:glycosyltransferase [Subsaximicrobium wynnwilliamsii]|uniref:Glycosyltransferase n=1 Tax=Subsaximicrobium wynnwilliamsii TaxID=291179 RepID=A0A5C6ZJF0_9FLAO|nr:glycosyltransferase family 2 protein [Subsaximicrobium wynnwilliamsii]TXD84395.1 glycosyltransferase [Subsaximicrobium wynnwilliamsii]TXD90076.1 glycosyltransferase [Subsaximicrobium wynnwilliamsii]TXE04128.1 glycosyltransferase [Subsaximicrobium wynnwilliamsii]